MVNGNRSRMKVEVNTTLLVELYFFCRPCFFITKGCSGLKLKNKMMTKQDQQKTIEMLNHAHSTSGQTFFAY